MFWQKQSAGVFRSWLQRRPPEWAMLCVRKLILPQPVEETLERYYPSDVCSLDPSWDEISSTSSSSRRPSSRLHLHCKIPDPVCLGWSTEHSWSDLILAFFQYSAALKESCSVMRHEPSYTNPQSCAKFSLILFLPFNSASVHTLISPIISGSWYALSAFLIVHGLLRRCALLNAGVKCRTKAMGCWTRTALARSSSYFCSSRNTDAVYLSYILYSPKHLSVYF